MRTLAAPAATALGQPVVVCHVLLEMMFSIPVRFNDSPVTINYNGADWIGAGNLGTVEPFRDATGEVVGAEFSMSGLPTENISLALGESPRGKQCRVYLAILDPNTHAVLDAPLIFPGYLDTMSIQEEGSTCSIGVTAVHMGKHLQRVKSNRYTDADQRRLFPGDSSLRFILSQSQHQDIWPSASYFRK